MLSFTIIYIEVGTVSIHILRFEFTAIVIDRAFLTIVLIVLCINRFLSFLRRQA